MELTIRDFRQADIEQMLEIWNAIVEEGNAFPQEERMDAQAGAAFFAGQSVCAVAEYAGGIAGLYILHPNNIGRCGHICNASYVVDARYRGMQIGEQLVRDCLHKAREIGFRILQFNAVVRTNTRARQLYERLGFVQLGTIPMGFRLKDGAYADICPYYIAL